MEKFFIFVILLIAYFVILLIAYIIYASKKIDKKFKKIQEILDDINNKNK
jgi:hypothetical protein